MRLVRVLSTIFSQYSYMKSLQILRYTACGHQALHRGYAFRGIGWIACILRCYILSGIIARSGHYGGSSGKDKGKCPSEAGSGTAMAMAMADGVESAHMLYIMGWLRRLVRYW